MQSCFEAHRATLERTQLALACGMAGAVEKRIDNPEAAQVARARVAIPERAHSADPVMLDEAAAEATAASVNLSCHLTGRRFLNQGASFSDDRVGGAKRAGRADPANAALVAGRSRRVSIRRTAVA